MTLCGVLNLDKPEGPTSRAMVDRVAKLVRPAKAGHAGTLDPLATGVLVVCVGHATRLINLVQEGRKGYVGRFVLGLQSDTDDITGQVHEGGDYRGISRAEIESLLPEWIGRIDQVPPQFSALHVEGKRAHSLARQGQVVELSARPVDVFSIRLTKFELPEIELEIECGSGTYIRSIGRDLGAKLGCGAVMKQLRRTYVGPFHVDNAINPDDLTRDRLESCLRPPTEIVANLPRRTLSVDEVLAIRQGRLIAATSSINRSTDVSSGVSTTDARIVLVDQNGTMVGIAEPDATQSRLQPRIVFPS